MLYTEPTYDSLKALPSPNELKNKIIIKARKITSIDEIDGQQDEDESGDDEGESDNDSVSSLQDVEEKSESKIVPRVDSARKSRKELRKQKTEVKEEKSKKVLKRGKTLPEIYLGCEQSSEV